MTAASTTKRIRNFATAALAALSAAALPAALPSAAEATENTTASSDIEVSAEARIGARMPRTWAPHVRRFILPTRARSKGRQLATWYGPGLWGNGLACGGRLKRSTWGIAHRTLPCGTLVSLAFRGRAVAVRVIDRGPFSGADIDLTKRTSDFLRFTGRGTGSVKLTVIKRYRL